MSSEASRWARPARTGGPARAGPRTPALVYSALATTLVLTIGMVALSSRQPPPPTIAEFSPQAVEQIKDAPTGQQSGFGEELGSASTDTSGGQIGAATPPPPPDEENAIVVPRVKRCVGNPPRQTEDPKSPPCVPYFDGDNGGATWKGVTKNEIRIAVPFLYFFEDEAGLDGIVSHFNNRYEFYGRRIKIRKFGPRDGFYATPNPANMQADAIDVDTVDGGSFASLSYGGRFGAEHHYYDELSRRQIMSIAHRVGTLATEARYNQMAPYQWNTTPGMDTIFRNYGQFVCNVLEGKPPIYAGTGSDPSPARPERVFGLIYGESTDGSSPPIEFLRNSLSACGVTPVEFKNRETLDTAERARNSQSAIFAMSQATPPVTSVMCFCDVSNVRDGLMVSAESNGYHPEWLLSTYIDNDVDNSFRQVPPDQARRVIGLTYRDKWLPRENSTWYWAAKEGKPDYVPAADNQGYPMGARYQSLLLLASGIQLAGPNLTPTTFQAGIARANFNNDGAGEAPYYQARIGFDGGRHTMTDDAAMYWYDRTQPGTVEPADAGAVCYVRRGTRYSLGNWPSEHPQFYTGPCT